MPRAVTESTSCLLMQIPPAEKVRLMRAAALERTSLKEFVLRHALLAAEAVIEKSECLALDEEQTRFIRNLLDNPPPPNARLVVAAKAYSSRKLPRTWWEEPASEVHEGVGQQRERR